MHCLQPFQPYWSEVVCHAILIYLLELKSEPIEIQLALVVRVDMGFPEMAAIQIQNIIIFDTKPIYDLISVIFFHFKVFI